MPHTTPNLSPSCGLRTTQIPDHIQQTSIPLSILYPTEAPEHPQHFGPYTLPLAPNATPTGTNLPIVVFSHGNGGTPWAYRDLAKHIARAGYIVALPEHIGNSRTDNTLADTPANLANRPRHITLTLDAIYNDPHAPTPPRTQQSRHHRPLHRSLHSPGRRRSQSVDHRPTHHEPLTHLRPPPPSRHLERAKRVEGSAALHPAAHSKSPPRRHPERAKRVEGSAVPPGHHRLQHK